MQNNYQVPELLAVEEKQRNFLPQDFKFKTWDDIKPYFESLKKAEINSVEELKNWLKQRSELEAFLGQDLAWRYIKLSITTDDAELKEDYNYAITQIRPKATPLFNELDHKFAESPFADQLEGEAYAIYLRSVRNSIALFREENIALKTQEDTEAQKFHEWSAQQTITYQDKELTLQQASIFLQNPDRGVRKEVWELIAQRRLQDSAQLNQLYDDLIAIRQQIALNAGKANYRDYQYDALGRFDYGVEDVAQFRESIAEELVPIVAEMQQERARKLGLETLRPYDLDVDISGQAPLRPYENERDLIQKASRVLEKLHPQLRRYLEIMDKKGFLDLESRKGKAPGGYNYPLDEIGIPFIFMNGTGKFRDLVTMVHEAGHAVHSFVSRDLELNAFKETPSEIAELASMSMELLSMTHWDEFFNNPADLKRAKRDQLKVIIEILPWIATVDAFQDWVYTHPQHTAEERQTHWVALMQKFGSPLVDWTGYEEMRATRWHAQLHIFERPFYYIEYGIAQLGAIAVWREFKKHPQEALQNYLYALSLGYTRTIPEIYEAAGIKFSFSKPYIGELAAFLKAEIAGLG